MRDPAGAPVASGASAIDVGALGRWMDSRDLPGRGLPVQARLLSGGRQNEIFEIRRGDFRAALRRPPAAAPAERDAGILREWRLIEALTGTDVPVADAVAACDDPSVLGRPFYLMDVVDGWSVMNTPDWWAPPFDTDLAARGELAYELINGIVLMGEVDWKARGLGDLGRPAGYHDRQVERWTRFYQRIRAREIPGLDEATAWLARHRPLDFVPGIMHGDYQFPNVMFRHGAPGRLAAILDWEMGTVGDPKLDVAWALHSWPEDPTGPSDNEYLVGMPARSTLLAHYARSSGRQVDDFDYYLVLAKWKLAIVLEQGYQRANGDPKLEDFGGYVVKYMREAAEIAESSDYPAVS
ncbi:phosphotransferase family protein [Frankia nepalensis]|uniref:Phosphotransferase family protein n=1 Tax=Frankia nepalensis TaxID=1836974 RepID=A0A937RGZ4_9ACTN|nr:phosphotransferase family protein [Frankia nepalensis]MBL7627189.1 phosphotransferase family protein [Frankia nepalensis]